jgi:hypothetical protein
MPQVVIDYTEAELSVIRRHAQLLGRGLREHIYTLTVGSGRAFVSGERHGAIPQWTGRTQHARNSHVAPGADK